MFVIRILKEIVEWTKTLIFVFSITILINVFIFEPYTVSGSSMEPTFQGADIFSANDVLKADRVFLFKLPHILGVEAKHGDIVIVDSRVERIRTLKDEFLDNFLVSLIRGHRSEDFWIKRVIGKEGDVLEYIDGKVYRNGEELNEPYINEEMEEPFTKVVVPENHVYVMGDNRNLSKDSRAIGAIPVENIRGSVVVRYYPFEKIRTF
ncbi:signal peptidase I [Caldalkalibacillus mannanilyticus]|uniref:signal peptidase I n=1 Tax=Caldalkalibacillus mannanilyticus TaxID=1418 RepID=UPI00046A24C4|nr:signal peptidase I [Caldalkalibacillus mannanilyticus]